MDKNWRLDLICLDTSQPALSDGFEGLREVSSWGIGWDAVPQTYCRWEEAVPVRFCSGVRDEEFGLVATGGVLGGAKSPHFGFCVNQTTSNLIQHADLVTRAPAGASKFSFLTRAEALEVGLKSPEMLPANLLSTISSLPCRCF